MQVRREFPLPDTEWPGTREFWAGAARGELLIPRCDRCAAYVWYPEPKCPQCGGEHFTWARMSGEGRLFSYVVVHHVFLPQFEDKVPYIAVLVALDEDPNVHIVSNLVDCTPEDLEIDMPVKVVFRPLAFPGIERQVMAPMFTPASEEISRRRTSHASS